jgi:malate dehydrogenase
MREVAIVGAGELGGTTAHLLAQRDAAARVRIVDDRGSIAEGKALDIMQSAPIAGFATLVTGSSDLATAGGADIVVIADRAGGSEWQGEDALLLTKRIAAMMPTAVIVCAGRAQREVVGRAVDELRIDESRILGSAPEAVASRARGLVALALDASPRDVTLTVLGNPPSETIIPWTDAAVAGYQLTRLMAEPVRRRLAARIDAIGPSGPHALAAAAGKVVDAIFGRSLGIVSCFVAPGGTGHRTRTTALPVRLNWRGVDAIVLPELSAIDRVALENVMDL